MQCFVEHLGADSWIPLLAQPGEIHVVPIPRADPENHPASREMVEGDRHLRNLPRSAAWKRRDGRPNPDPRRRAGHRGRGALQGTTG
jgi:hypothetical protein